MSRNYLAIDTSGRSSSIALSIDGEIAARDTCGGRGTLVELPRRIENMLGEQAIGIPAVNGLCACAGPGSFTGIKVGLSFSRTLAQSLDVPIQTFSGLEALYLTLKGESDSGLILRHCTGDEFYAGLYRTGDKAWEGILRTHEIAVFVDEKEIPFIGTDDGAKLKSLVKSLPRPFREYDTAQGVSTAEIGLKAAMLKLDEGDGRWIDAKANYLRRSQAERNLQPDQD